MDAKSIPDVVNAIAAVVKAVGLFIVIPGAAVYLIKRPPQWVLEWRVKKLSVAGVAAEFEKQPVSPPSEKPLQIATEPEAPPKQLDGGPGNDPDSDNQASWFNELVSGNVQAGLEGARSAAAAEKPSEGALSLAMALSVAYQRGLTEVLGELGQLAQDYPKDFRIHQWYAMALDHANREEDAIREERAAVETTTTPKEKATAIASLSRMLIKFGRREDAIRELARSLSEFEGAPEKAVLYSALAKAHEAGGRLDLMFVYYEAALREETNDTSVRFDLAYAYGNNGAPALSLYHYRRLLKLQPLNDTYLNNAGWAAQQLKLNIAAVTYYQTAAERGSTLARSNVASLLLQAGFVAQANRELDLALEVGASEVDDRVHSVRAEINSRVSAEETETTSLIKKAKALVKWRWMEADARLKPDAADRIAGQWSAGPDQTLFINPDGQLTGTITVGLFGKAATVTGRVEGELLRFKFISEPSGSGAFLAMLGTVKGEGLLFFKNGQLVGYSHEGEMSLDVPAAKEVRNWIFTRVSSLPGTLSLPSAT